MSIETITESTVKAALNKYIRGIVADFIVGAGTVTAVNVADKTCTVQSGLVIYELVNYKQAQPRVNDLVILIADDTAAHNYSILEQSISKSANTTQKTAGTYGIEAEENFVVSTKESNITSEDEFKVTTKQVNLDADQLKLGELDEILTNVMGIVTNINKGTTAVSALSDAEKAKLLKDIEATKDHISRHLTEGSTEIKT